LEAGDLVSRDTSFYYAFLVLPPRKRNAIIAVWDFCRAVDDAVDEAAGIEEQRRGLVRWRRELAAIYEGVPETPQGRGLEPYVREFGLPRAQFEALIDGVEMDLRHDHYPTAAALEEYCRRVASAVGLVCVEIFGYEDPRTRIYAEQLGIALQLTNIIRDIASDLERGRVYLPTEDLERFGVTDDALRQGVVTPQIRNLLRFECARAHAFYAAAAAQLPPVDAKRLVAAEIMGAIYLEILRRIEGAGYDVFTRRIRVPRPQRFVLAFQLWLRRLLK
jgi:phytoene synthase